MQFSFGGPVSKGRGVAAAGAAAKAPAAGGGFSMAARKQQLKPAVAGFGFDSDDEE
jgi:hypothetical protein